jgi:hypothetical protein
MPARCYRGLAVHWAYYSSMNVGMIYLSFIHLALQRSRPVSSYCNPPSTWRQILHAITASAVRRPYEMPVGDL